MDENRTNIHRVVYAYKTRQTIFVFSPQNLIFLCPGIFWEMHVLLLLVYLGTMMYIRQTFQIETAFIMYYNIISSIETHTRGPRDPGSLT